MIWSFLHSNIFSKYSSLIYVLCTAKRLKKDGASFNFKHDIMPSTFIWSSKMRCLRQYQFSCKSWRMIFNCKRSRRWRRRREIIFCHHFKHVSPGMWFGKWIWLPVSVVCAAARTDSSSTRRTLGSIHILFWIWHQTNKLGALSKKDPLQKKKFVKSISRKISWKWFHEKTDPSVCKSRSRGWKCGWLVVYIIRALTQMDVKWEVTWPL